MADQDWADEEVARLIPNHLTVFEIDDFRVFLADAMRKAEQRGYDRKAAEIAEAMPSIPNAQTQKKLSAMVRGQHEHGTYATTEATISMFLMIAAEIDDIRAQLPAKDDGK